MKQNITTTEEIITPVMAKEIMDEHYVRLEKGECIQRRVAERQVNRYAADMRVGNWKLSPQPITFDVKGNIIDGQHRLAAVIKAGTPVTMMVSRGWPEMKSNGSYGDIGVIDVVDRGRPRSNGSQLQLHGVASGNVVAASATAVAYIAVSGTKNAHPGVTYPMLCYIMDRLGIKKHIDAIFNMAIVGTKVGRTIGPLAYYHTVRPAKAKDFAERVFTLDVDKNTGPQVYARYMRDRKPGRQVEAIAALAACIRAWENNEEIAFIRLNTNATQWLAALNPKLRENIRTMIN